jgi:hypothetical protein
VSANGTGSGLEIEGAYPPFRRLRRMRRTEGIRD